MLPAISRFGSKGMVSMPDLSGLALNDAKNVILSSGLKVGSVSSTNTSSSENNGKISGQSVSATTLVDYETSISLQYYNYVAPPPPDPVVPYIVGVSYGAIEQYTQTTTNGSCGVNGDQYAYNTYTLTTYRAKVYDLYSNGSTVLRSPVEYNYEYPSEETFTGTKTKVVGSCGWTGTTITCSEYDTSCSGGSYQRRQLCTDSATGETTSDTLIATYSCGCSTSYGSCNSSGFKSYTQTCYNPDGSTYTASSGSTSCTSCGSLQSSSCSNGLITHSRTCVTGGVSSTSYTYSSCCTSGCTARYYFACSGGVRRWTQVCTATDCSETRSGGEDACCAGSCGSWGAKTYVATRVWVQSRTCIDANCNTFSDSRTGCDAYCGSWTNVGSCTASPYGRYQNQSRTCVDSSCGTYSETRSISC